MTKPLNFAAAVTITTALLAGTGQQAFANDTEDAPEALKTGVCTIFTSHAAATIPNITYEQCKAAGKAAVREHHGDYTNGIFLTPDGKSKNFFCKVADKGKTCYIEVKP